MSLPQLRKKYACKPVGITVIGKASAVTQARQISCRDIVYCVGKPKGTSVNGPGLMCL